MKTWILLSFFFINLAPVSAQRTYTEAMQQGDNALRRGEYRTAIDKYFAAEAFDPDKKDVVRAKVNTVFDKVEKLRQDAERAQKRAEDALAEVRLKNASIFESFTALGTELIYKLDYAEALEKMKVAVEIDVDSKLKKQQLTEPIAELLYLFAEGGRRPELARISASLLLQLQPSATLEAQLKKCMQENWESRDQFTPLLEALPSYEVLQERYYPRMITIPLGEDGIFEMGSDTSDLGHEPEELIHKVHLYTYEIAETPVTFYQFALFCEAAEREIASRAPYWGIRGDHPAVNINWYEAAEYTNWLNRQNGLLQPYTIMNVKDSDTNNIVNNDFLKWKVDWNEGTTGYRLPTEAEWELAARGGVGAVRTLYAGCDTLEEVGWYWQNSGDERLDGDWDLNRIYDNKCRTHTVKGKRHNGIGVYDMSGNVLEWCWDWFSTEYYKECEQEGLVNMPKGAVSSTVGRVFRGGSWYSTAVRSRVAERYGFSPARRDILIGFRPVFVP